MSATLSPEVVLRAWVAVIEARTGTKIRAELCSVEDRKEGHNDQKI